MAYLYYDDSKHDQAGFYLGVFVYSKRDLEAEIIEILKEEGLDVEKDKFKSSLHVGKNPEQKRTREKLRRLIFGLKIFVVVSENNEASFQEATLTGLKQLIEKNSKEIDTELSIFLDQGIVSKTTKNQAEIIAKFSINIEQNSIKIKGIQLANPAQNR